MLIRRKLFAASLLGLALVSACTTTSKGDPLAATPASSTPGNGEEDLPFAGAPKVDNPLDTSRYEKEPCEALTADQAQSLNLPPTGVINNDVALGVGCVWRNSTTHGYVGIDFLVQDPRGLSPEYQNRTKYDFFEVLPDIEGFPAIARGGSTDRDHGICTVMVGVADDMVFASNVQLSQVNIGQKEPCDVAAQVAGLAVQTMRRGG